MRRTAAFILHELRTQGRSLRFRVAAGAYVTAGSLPAALTYLRRSGEFFRIGGATYASETMTVLPLLTGVLALLLSLDGIGRERSSGAWTTLGLTDLTNAGYLVRRWLALQVIVLPLSALPLLVTAGLVAAGGYPAPAPAVFWAPWLLHVLPLAALGVTLGLGLGTLGGNGMGAFVAAAVFLVALPWALNGALAPLGYRIQSPLRWLDHPSARLAVSRIAQVYGSLDDQGRFWLFPIPASEAGFDLSTRIEQSFADSLLPVLIAALAFGGAIARLRRTRPDLPPWTVRPAHPLRSFLQLSGRLRDAVLPDPALAPADRIAIALTLLLAAAAGAALLTRVDRYDERAWRMVRAEMNPPRPTPLDVLPGLWTVEGTVAADGEVALRVTGVMRNTGRSPQSHLAFALDEELKVREVAADAGRVRPTRVWDRLTVELDPPLAPGASRTLRFRLAGRPAQIAFAGRPKPERLVDPAFGGHQRARFDRDLIDLSPSYRIPAVSGYRVDLRAEDLLPVPRYGPWTFSNNYGYPEVAAETVFPRAEVRLALAVPPGLFLADACGGVARGGRLESRCALPLHEVTVAGGRHQLLAGNGAGGAAVAVFPSHSAAGELHLGFLARGSRMLGEAWPGLGRLDGTVVLEWPDNSIHNRVPSYWFFSGEGLNESFVEVRGRLIFLSEANLIQTRPIDPEALVAEVVSSRLSSRRRLDPDHPLFFLQLFRTLALQRLGLGPERGAVVGPLDLKDIPVVQVPALGEGYSAYWRLRFPALVAALEHRAGREPLRAAVDELLARGGDRPATFDEFAEILRRRAEQPVEGMFRDFFRAGRLPELVLEDVAFHRAGPGWRATGRVHNLADGEATCRVVLTAALTPAETTVTVGTGGTASFSLETQHRPQAVFLDPDHECHRMERKGAPRDRVFFEGGLP
ncbi:MAG TPA: hypothetical protein VKM72_28980 [Thermoanaerobaculia bacterium]|nr:hypothetical protein [Thermoanaerobaculia bacterium]